MESMDSSTAHRFKGCS
jgi:hypothetical protein